MTRDSYSKHFPPTVPAEVAARAIELDDMPVGVALAVRGGFIFCATDRTFFPLDGQRFRHVNQVSRAVDTLARGLSPRRAGGAWRRSTRAAAG